MIGVKDLNDSGPFPAQTTARAGNGIPISVYEFRLLRDHIHDYCGIYFDDSRMSTLASRLMFRLKLLEISSFAGYYNYLRYNPRSSEEMEDLIPHLTNNETYFFREMNQLVLFTTEIVDRLRRRKGGGAGAPLRIVSCGCSSGEEAYTLAMLLEESGRYGQGIDFQITGVDIDGQVLDKAKRGVYTSYSMRATDQRRIARFFHKENGKYRLDARIRERVTFLKANLLDREAMTSLESADAIFCRNVLIYFSDRSIRAVTDLFHETLAPHGVLFLGHSESLNQITDRFIPRRFPNAILYGKREGL